MFKTMSKVCFNGSLTNKNNALHSSSHCRKPKHCTHIILERRWNTKPNSAIKVVKGLHHMCPCHQPYPKRGLVTYTRWITTKPGCYLCHTIKYGIIIHFFYHFYTQNTIGYSTCSLANWTLCNTKIEAISLHLPQVRTLLH